MKLRNLVSITALFVMAHLLLTSTILYVMPAGRVAYWSQWSYLGLEKADWGRQHVVMGVCFVILMLVHTLLNARSIAACFRSRSQQVLSVSSTVLASLSLMILLTLMIHYQIPPASWVDDFAEHFKEQASLAFGEPPYGHAELSSLKIFTRRVGLDTGTALLNLEKYGMTGLNPDQTIGDLARQYHVNPSVIYQRMQGGSGEWPEHPAVGLGRLKITDFLTRNGFSGKRQTELLQRAGLSGRENETFRAAAETMATEPIELYQKLNAERKKMGKDNTD